jgi:dienelactone hydrolase
MPYVASKQRPFLESAFISYSTVLEEVRAAANASNVAVAIFDGRGTVGDAPIGEADTFELLRDITAHYSVDPRRIYLYGVCAGGYRALMLAEHYPQIFAAVGSWGPELGTSDENEPTRDSPFTLIDRLSTTPVVLLKGQLDDELPAEIFLEFADRLRHTGDFVTAQIVPNTMHDPIREEAVIFPQLVTHARGPAVVDIQSAISTAVKNAKDRAEVPPTPPTNSGQ